MAVAEFVNVTSERALDVTSKTFSHTTSGGNELLLVFVVGFRTQSGVTFDGNALTKVAETTGSTTSIVLWKLEAPGAKTANVVVSYTGNADSEIHAVTVKNAPQSNAIDNSATTQDSADATSSTLAITPNQNDTLALFAAGINTVNITSLTGDATIANSFGTNGLRNGISRKDIATAASTNFTVSLNTNTTGTRNLLIVTIKYEAAPAAAATGNMFMMF